MPKPEYLPKFVNPATNSILFDTIIGHYMIDVLDIATKDLIFEVNGDVSKAISDFGTGKIMSNNIAQIGCSKDIGGIDSAKIADFELYLDIDTIVLFQPLGFKEDHYRLTIKNMNNERIGHFDVYEDKVDSFVLYGTKYKFDPEPGNVSYWSNSNDVW